METIKSKLQAIGRSVKITPECDNMSSSLQTSAMISLALSLLFFVSCAGLYAYLHFVLKEDDASKATRQNLMQYSLWSSTAYIAINTLNSIWLYMSANGLTECIKQSE